MKRLVPLFAAALFACGSHPSAPVAPTVESAVEIVPVASGPIALDHAEWAVTLPAGWKYDDDPALSDDDVSTKILAAESPTAVGKHHIMVSISTIQYGKDITTERFVTAIADQADSIIRGSTSMGSKFGELDDRPASLTMLYIEKEDIGLGVLATADDKGTGYIVSCGGDAAGSAGKVAGATCRGILESFHVKKR